MSLLVGEQNAPLQKGNGCDAGQNPKYNELLPLTSVRANLIKLMR